MLPEGGGIDFVDPICDGIPDEIQALITTLIDGDLQSVLQNKRFQLFIHSQSSFEDKKREVDRICRTALEQRDPVQCVSLIVLAVASLLSYVQSNVTGPETNKACEDNRSVLRELGLNGEDFLANTQTPELLLLARIILVEPLRLEKVSAKNQIDSDTDANFALQIGGMTVELEVEDESVDFYRFVRDHLPCWLWWAGRAVFIHQQFLKHNSLTLRTESIALAESIEKIAATRNRWNRQERAQLYLEIAQWEHLYRRVQDAKRYVDTATDLLDVSIELSGAMGIRTVHQVDPKPQLVVLCNRKASETEVSTDGKLTDQQTEKDQAPDQDQNKEDDVLRKPEWKEAIATPQLSQLEQCLVLAKSDCIELGTANDELKAWEIEPFRQLISSQTTSSFIIQVIPKKHADYVAANPSFSQQAKASFSQVLHEKERGRTRERALTEMENLVDRFRHGADNTFDRLRCVFSVRIPGIIQLRKQLAQIHVSFGMISSALSTYEELECWDELILCYRMLEKKAIADQIVSRRLDADPHNPALLCTLADLRTDPQFYTKAWEVSDHKYPRAQRSLARYYLEKKSYKQAAHAFELALGLNALHADAWFSLGYCYLKLADDRNALKAFTWSAQLDPENGESWNNLGALWMRQKKPARALWALKEAIKHKRESWETWENYAKASQECSEYFLTVQGMTKVLELSSGKRLQSDLMRSLVNAYLGLGDNASEIDAKKLGVRLEEFLRKASACSAWTSDCWLLLSKVHCRLQQPIAARECLMKCFRQIQGTTWKKETHQFELLVTVVADLVHHGKEFGCSKGEISSLALQLRGIIKQAERCYQGSEKLQQLLQLQKETAEQLQSL